MIALLRQLLRFAGVGVAAMAVHFVVAVALARAGVPPLIANVGGFLSAVPVSYQGHRRWTFGEGREAAFRRFALVALGGFCANETLLALLLRITPLRYEVALTLVLGGVALGTYLLCRGWAFRALDPID